jgi:hypothetical protein
MVKPTALKFITDLRVLLGLVIVATIGVSLQQYFLGNDHIGNFLIFKTSFSHLMNDQPLYAGNQQYNGTPIDFYKYSPAFSILFAPIAALPNVAGVVVWNLLNTLILFFAVKSLPLTDNKKALVIILTLLELVISLQNCQSNALIAGLLIFSFTAFEKKNLLLASLCIVLSVYIKLFGVVAFLLFLFYPGKLKFILYSIMWSVILFFLPLVVVGYGQLMNMYHDWANLLKMDQSVSWGLSVMGIIKSWFNIDIPKTYVQLAGAALLCLPLINILKYNTRLYRLLYLCCILIWIVIFNHKAESPTFIIALTGMAIWFAAEEATALNKALIIFALLLTSFATSDLVPHHIRVDVVAAYALKALPSLVLWLVILYRLLFKKGLWQAQVARSTGE